VGVRSIFFDVFISFLLVHNLRCASLENRRTNDSTKQQANMRMAHCLDQRKHLCQSQARVCGNRCRCNICNFRNVDSPAPAPIMRPHREVRFHHVSRFVHRHDKRTRIRQRFLPRHVARYQAHLVVKIDPCNQVEIFAGAVQLLNGRALRRVRTPRRGVVSVANRDRVRDLINRFAFVVHFPAP
ncbi:MAG: hypothetical protein KAI80_08200, partial [Hyphomicrobiaceae bacterium]|nr:hypothetical protein [Hyphomicrobiaceae bacterium]